MYPVGIVRLGLGSIDDADNTHNSSMVQCDVFAVEEIGHVHTGLDEVQFCHHADGSCPYSTHAALNNHPLYFV